MTNRFRAISNDSYTFYAKYRGKRTVNTVSLKSVNRLKYEKYHKNVALFKCTGTWCAYCPMMTAQLAKLPEEALKHSVQLCWHGHGSGASDPLAITFPNAQADCANMLLSVMSSRTGKSMGFPTVILDNTKAIVDRSYIAISDAIWEVRADWPATCGIKLSSSESNGAITVNAELNSSTGGEYDVAFALLRDGIYIADGTETDKTYNHVVSAATANIICTSAIRSQQWQRMHQRHSLTLLHQMFWEVQNRLSLQLWLLPLSRMETMHVLTI